MKETKRFWLYCILVSITSMYSCGEQPMRTLDIPNPTDESNDSINLADETDFSDMDSFVDNVYTDMSDTIGNDSMPNLRRGTMDTTFSNALPTSSSLKNIQAVFLSADCSGSKCNLIFENETEGSISFCGAYGDFVSADLRSANPELIGKRFMVIYRTGLDKSKSDSDKDSAPTCNTIVFAKPL